MLDAFEDKVEWYKKAGFGEYPKRADSRRPGTVAMKMDFIDRSLADAYAESCIMEDSYGELWMHDTFGTRSGAEFL